MLYDYGHDDRRTYVGRIERNQHDPAAFANGPAADPLVALDASSSGRLLACWKPRAKETTCQKEAAIGSDVAGNNYVQTAHCPRARACSRLTKPDLLEQAGLHAARLEELLGARTTRGKPQAPYFLADSK